MLAAALTPDQVASQFDSVALWAGLIGSVIGIVLSIVAMVFTWVVNKRSDKISDHTIQSLQKIESTVETLSTNTNGLIKAAWEKMLGSVGAEQNDVLENQNQLPVKELAAGIAAEIRSELSENKDPAETEAQSPNRLDRLEQSLARLENSLQALAETRPQNSTAVDRVVAKLRQLSPEARALLYAIRNRHINLKQYRALARRSLLASALNELRDKALLLPFEGIEDGEKVPVYYLSQAVSRRIEQAALLLEDLPTSVIEMVVKELKKVDYVAEKMPG